MRLEIKWQAVLCGAGLLALSGCASAPKTEAISPVDGKTAITVPAQDKVLWQYRSGLAAMRRGEFDLAKRLLDDAILSIGASGQDKTAKKARGYFSGESVKTFRGEPYERVMAYFYRGILYWMDGEPDNARACFRNAQLQDSDTENKEYASDYVLLDYLDGYATAKLAGDGSDAYERAKKACKHGVPPPYNAQANVLVFLEFGEGPAKYSFGEHGEKLGIREGQSVARGALLKMGGQAYRMAAYDDLNFQATTRGGRVMDHILANKAVFKSTTDAVGNAALISGAVLATHRNEEVGLGLLAAGLVGKIVSAATTPAADTRAWDNLPQFLSFAALELPPGEHEASVEFLDGSGRVLTSKTKVFKVSVPADSRKETVLFISDKN